MTNDARFEDVRDAPLRLRALTADDLGVLSGLCQDAVLRVGDMSYRRKARRFAILLNRMRWEHEGTSPERVRSMLVFEDVEAVRTAGIDQSDGDMVMSLLSMQFVAGPDGTGRIDLVFAGDGELALQVEALEAVLQDVTRPYGAVSGQRPSHPD